MTTAASNRDPLAPITLVAFVLMLALVAARCTFSEWAGEVSTVANTGVDTGGPGVTTTIVLNGLCLLPALLVLVRRAIDAQYVLRWQPAHVAMFGLVGWITASAIWASNKPDALLSASTWWAAAAVLFAAGQLVRSWARLRPVLGLAAGLTLVLASQSLLYRFYEQPQLQQYWDTDESIKVQRATNPNDFLLQQMDKKVHGTEQQGFFKSPNSFACVTVLAIFAAAGLGVQRLTDRDEPLLGGILLIGPVLALPILIWTGSRTAIGLFAIGTIALPLAWRLRDRLAAASRGAFAGGAIAFLLGVAAVIGIGLKTGGLFVETLTFRWHYWLASVRLVRDHLLLGVGWTNFGTHYLAYRLPAAPEEVKYPHNLFVQFATETGVVGLVLCVAWLALLLWRLTRPVLPRVATTSPTASSKNSAWMKPALAIAVVFTVVRAAVTWDLIVLQAAPLAINFAEAGKTLLFGLCVFTAVLLAGVRDTGRGAADDRPARFAVWAAIVGLLTFLLHNQLDFAAMETGPLLLFVLIAGALLGVRHPGVAGRRTHTAAAIGGLAATFVALIAVAGLWAVPTVLAEAKAAEAEAAGRNQRPSDALDHYREAIADAPVATADYPRRAARFGDPAKSAEVVGWLSQAIAADPADAQNWLSRARVNVMAHAPIGTVAGDYEQFVRRNPNDAAIRLEYAHVLDAAGQTDAAVEQYRAALAATDALKPNEPRRLPADQVATIKARLGIKN